MVADSCQLHHFCMGGMLSRYYSGEKGNYGESDGAEYFHFPVFIYIGQVGESQGGIFYRSRCFRDFHSIFVAHIHGVPTVKRKADDGFGNCLSGYNSLYAGHKHSFVKDDRGACGGWVGYPVDLYSADGGLWCIRM